MKKIIMGAMCAIMLAACGSGQGKSADTQTVPGTVQVSEADSATKADTTAAGDSATPQCSGICSECPNPCGNAVE